MLESNHKAWLTSHGKEIERNDENDEDVGKMLEEILQESGFADSRPAKMDVDDFLNLLALFHKHGFHFGG